MNIIVIISYISGVVLLLLSLIFIILGRFWLQRITYLLNPHLHRKTSENLSEILEHWFEQPEVFLFPPTSKLSKKAVCVVHQVIIRTFNAISISREYFWQNVKQRLEFDNFNNRITNTIQITIFRFCILPFIVGVGLILSGSLWWILILPIAWIPTFDPFSQIYKFSLIIDILSGWIYGGLIYQYFFTSSNFWYSPGNVIGIVLMFIVQLLIVTLIWSPYFLEKYATQMK